VSERCEVPGCRGEVAIVYLDRGLCDAHWNELMADDESRSRLRMVLGLDATTSAAMEEPMSEAKQTETKPAKKSKPAREAKPKKAAATKAARAKKERTPKEDLVVFACRVAEAERVKFHEATGPAGASRFARKLLVVFAAEDEAGFRALLKEAREART